jgi:PLP dependent protein
MSGSIAQNLEKVRRRIEAAARRAGRDAGSITLVGVSKTIPVTKIGEAIEAGLGDLGENRVQEARDKAPDLPGTVRWHLVGHLQSNKVNHAARLFHVVHSVDSVDLLRRLDHAAAREGRTLEVLVQIDMAGEATKFGVEPGGLDPILEAAGSCGSAVVRGLMVLPPYDPDPGKARPYFRRLRELLEEARARHRRPALDRLSMGMTEDFEVAIEEGATLVRVGRALFGERTQGGGA